jgi:protein tyrosine phosphatase (PTP) superfamily phosphohydrolase (DUF442 family)
MRGWLVVAIALAAPVGARAQPTLDAPNVVPITERLVTSGQPTAEALGKLKAMGFGAVIYLAPPTVSDAVRDEAMIVAKQGITYVNLPIRFDEPTGADFDAFAGVLRGLGDRKVLVHCQVNMRASTLVFLYRATVLHEDPRMAYESVSRVWTPNGPWRRLMEDELRKHQVKFEIL